MTTLTVSLHPSNFGAAIGELEDSFDRGWQDVLNDCGSAQLALANDDPDAGNVTRDCILRFDLDGVPAFAAIAEVRKRRSVAPGEEHDETTEISGRGTLAVWEQAVVYPEMALSWEPFADDRLFNFAAVGFDDSAWTAAVVTTYADQAVQPVNWADSAAEWIWDRSQAGELVAPAGDVYFRKTFSVADRVVAELKGASDDAFEAYVDGVRVLTGGPVYFGTSSSTQPFALSQGSHVLAVKATNANALKGGLRMTLLPINSDGSYGVPVVRTDATWKRLGYPASPPGYSPGKIIRLLLEEAKSRRTAGPLEAMTLGFSDTLDSDGIAWPTSPDVAFRVGLDCLSALRQLAETYCDVAMAANTLRLDAYVAGGRGQPRAAAVFVAGTNITDLQHEDYPDGTAFGEGAFGEGPFGGSAYV